MCIKWQPRQHMLIHMLPRKLKTSSLSGSRGADDVKPILKAFNARPPGAIRRLAFCHLDVTAQHWLLFVHHLDGSSRITCYQSMSSKVSVTIKMQLVLRAFLTERPCSRPVGDVP